MSKMTDEQIIKASKLIDKLRDAYNDYYDTSKSMPYDIDTTLRESAICLENALNEINRQQAEIEKLNVELVGMRGACNSYKIHYDNAKAEIESLNCIIARDNQRQTEKEQKDGDCISTLYNLYDKEVDENKKLNAEIERLEKELSTANNHITRLESQIERLLLMLKTKRAEAIKELSDDIYEEIDKAIKNNQDVKKQRRKRLVWRGNNVEDDTFLHYVEGKLDALKGIKCFVYDYVKEMVGEGK